MILKRVSSYVQVVFVIMAVTNQPGRFQPSEFQTGLTECCDDCGVCEHNPSRILFKRRSPASPDRFLSLSIRLVHHAVPAVCRLLHRQWHGRVLPVRPGHAHPQCLQDQIQHQSKISMPVWRKTPCNSGGYHLSRVSASKWALIQCL